MNYLLLLENIYRFPTISLPFPSLWLVCPLDNGGVVDEHAFKFGGVEFGELFPGPEQFPLVFDALWYIMESPLNINIGF